MLIPQAIVEVIGGGGITNPLTEDLVTDSFIIRDENVGDAWGGRIETLPAVGSDGGGITVTGGQGDPADPDSMGGDGTFEGGNGQFKGGTFLGTGGSSLDPDADQDGGYASLKGGGTSSPGRTGGNADVAGGEGLDAGVGGGSARILGGQGQGAGEAAVVAADGALDATHGLVQIKTDGSEGESGGFLGSNGAGKVVWVQGCGADGWVDDTAHTWTFATASTFTIAGVDLTTTFKKGTRLKWTQTTVKYGVVVSSTFSTNTTVTIAVNTDHTIANAAISANFYSYAANPQGYPGWFNFAPTNETGWSTANPFSAVSRFNVTGTLCYVEVHATGTSDNAATSFDAPIACENGTLPATPLLIVNNGTQAFGKVRFSTATLLVFGLSATSETWTASGTKTIFLQMTYGI